MKRSKIRVLTDLHDMEAKGELKHWFLLMDNKDGKQSYVRCYYTSWYEGTPIGVVAKDKVDKE